MASHDGRLSSRWVSLVLMMASTAAALTLTNFEPIVSSAIPLSCILSYNSQIPGCLVSDFQGSSTCSSQCVRGLLRTQETVQAACSGANANPRSLLGQVLVGNLVPLVCPGTPRVSTSTSSSRRPTATTTIAVPRTTSSPALVFTTVRSTSTTSTAATETDEPDEPDTSTFSTSPTPAPDTPVATPVEPSSSTTSQPATPPAATASPEPTLGNLSGGGSPFDIPASDASQLAACLVKASLVALGLGIILLQ